MKRATREKLIGMAVAVIALGALGADFGGVEFPHGEASFADGVVSYDPVIEDGEPEDVHREPGNALGAPDCPDDVTPGTRPVCSVSLGAGGALTLEFSDNVLAGSGDSDADLWIFEVGPDVEGSSVEISTDGSDWETLGTVAGGTQGIDIDAHGFGEADHFRFVRITDDPDDGEADGVTVGTDIDAVGATEPDIDGDGIPDSVELSGIRDDSGVVTTDLAALGANPCRETIAVEVDYMDATTHSHEPAPDAIDEIVEAFDRAPRPSVADCPYPDFVGSDAGIDLIVDVDDAVDHEDVVGLGDDFEAIRDDNFASERRPYFHYNLWVHDSKENSSQSGLCCNDGDFVVSLGSWTSLDVRDQSGTMMHELGHALGLGHGGTDRVNHKPNHLSVMSYVWQTSGVYDFDLSDFRLDYSRRRLPDLDESSLDEGAGIDVDDSADLWISWRDANFGRNYDVGDEVDWDGNNTIDAGTVNVDVNGDGVCVRTGDDGNLDTTPSGDDIVIGNRVHAGPDHVCDTEAEGDDEQRRSLDFSEPDPLEGSDDWPAITFRAIMADGAGGADDLAHPDVEPLTFEENQQLDEAQDEALSPDVAVTKSADRDEVLPGDVIEYSIEATNVGSGEAIDVELVDTLPDGSTETVELPDLAPGDSTTEEITFAVPVDSTDGAELVNEATVSASNVLGFAEENTANNTDEATVVVLTPVMELDKSADATVAPGGEITTTLTYRNTGGAPAADVTVTDTLPAEIHYSRALDNGDGPQPDEVERHEDGTTTLRFDVGPVPAGSGDRTIQFTARPTLVVADGALLINAAEVTFTDANDNAYEPEAAAATVTVDTPAPSRDPEGIGFWRNHPDRWSSETLARVQATDSRYDGADGSTPDGTLTAEEVDAALAPGGGMPGILERQLLATYLNLAEHRVVAGTGIRSEAADARGVATVADAVGFATDTLSESPHPRSGNRATYSDATDILDGLNNDRTTVY